MPLRCIRSRPHNYTSNPWTPSTHHKVHEITGIDVSFTVNAPVGPRQFGDQLTIILRASTSAGVSWNATFAGSPPTGIYNTGSICKFIWMDVAGVYCWNMV